MSGQITECAVCHEVKLCFYCEVCGKWICGSCKWNLPARAVAAAKERLHF